MYRLKLKLLQVIHWSKMSVTNLCFSTEIGTLCLDILPGKEMRCQNTGGGRESRKKTRERRAAERNDAFSAPDIVESASSTAVPETDAGSTTSEEPATKSSAFSSDKSD